MNSLSWLIYAAEVLGRVSSSFFFIAFGAAIATGVTIFLGMMSRADAQSDLSSGYRKEGAQARIEFWDNFLGKWPKRAAVVAVGFGAVSIVAPSNSTIYMIAASEMGEKVVTTPEAKEMLGDLREVIAKQIKKLKDDK